MDWSAIAVQALSKLPTSSIAQMLREVRLRGNQREDLRVISDLMDMGLVPAEYQGTAMHVRFAEDVDLATEKETARLATNIVRILDKAKALEEPSELKPPNDEFMRRWVDDASNESDETLQEMWARVLVGEMARPGSISRHTHSVVRELTPDVAEIFRTFCSYAMCSMDGKRPLVVATLATSTILGERGDSLKEHGLDYGAFIELAEYRLVSLPLEGSYRIPVRQSRTDFSFLLGDELCILGIPPVMDTSLDSVAIPGIRFSSAGRDLFPVVERFAPTKYADALEDYLKNMWGFTFQRAKWPLYRPDKFATKPESG